MALAILNFNSMLTNKIFPRVMMMLIGMAGLAVIVGFAIFDLYDVNEATSEIKKKIRKRERAKRESKNSVIDYLRYSGEEQIGIDTIPTDKSLNTTESEDAQINDTELGTDSDMQSDAEAIEEIEIDALGSQQDIEDTYVSDIKETTIIDMISLSKTSEVIENTGKGKKVELSK